MRFAVAAFFASGLWFWSEPGEISHAVFVVAFLALLGTYILRRM